MRVFSIFCTYISERVFITVPDKPERGSNDMYDTARRVALVKQRVRENTRRRQRREAISLSAFCLMLFTALAGAAAITALCIRLRNRENQKKGGTNKPARYEQEEKSQ